MTSTAYSAEWVLPVASAPIRDGVVVIENNRIVFVGSDSALEQRPEFRDFERRSFQHTAILPGLINTHCHLELTLMRGFLEDLPFRQWIRKLTATKYERLTSEDLAASALLGAAEAIRAGITTVADTGDSSSAFEAMLTSGLRGIAYREVFGPDPSVASESLQDLRGKIDTMRSAETDLVRVGVSPHAPYTVSADLFRRVAEYGSRESLDICIHAAESEAETQLMLNGTGAFAETMKTRGIHWRTPGVPTIKYLHSLGVLDSKPLLIHCVQAAADDFNLLARAGVRIAHCPKSNAKLGHGRMDLRAAREAGVTIGLGTDSVASNNRCDLIEEARFCGLIHRIAAAEYNDPSASDLLKLVTIDGARALRLDDRIGSLESGKQADLIAIDLSQPHNQPIHDPVSTIIFSATSDDVLFTMAAGRVLYDRGLTTIDAEDIPRRVNAALDRIRA